MKNLLVVLLIMSLAIAVCDDPGDSENDMNLTLSNDAFTGTDLRIDAYTNQSDDKCWIVTYREDTMIDRITPYLPKDALTTINSMQYLLKDSDILITQANGGVHHMLPLPPWKYAPYSTYQILVECGAQSCAMENFTTGGYHNYQAELIAYNFMYSLIEEPGYMLNLFLMLSFLSIFIIIPSFLVKKK